AIVEHDTLECETRECNRAGWQAHRRARFGFTGCCKHSSVCAAGDESPDCKSPTGSGSKRAMTNSVPTHWGRLSWWVRTLFIYSLLAVLLYFALRRAPINAIWDSVNQL